MGNLWCKIWNFFLGIFTQTVKAIAYAVKTVGEVAIGLAGDLLSAAGKALGLGKLFPLLLVGVGAYFILSHKEDDKDGANITLAGAALAGAKGGV